MRTVFSSGGTSGRSAWRRFFAGIGSRRLAGIAVFAACLPALVACFGGPEQTRLDLDFTGPPAEIAAGESALELGSTLFINREFAWRDGLLYVPRAAAEGRAAPLLVWLHGGGGHAHHARHLFPIAERYGVVMLSLDSRHNTWDGIDSPFGPDVRFMQRAMQYTIDRVAIDKQRIALGGLSDGASYALALGRSNGDLFTHLVAISPGRLRPPSPPLGKPKIFVGHGTRDTVYPLWHTRDFVAPGLQKAGYEVTYLEFDGPHWVTEFAGEEIIRWLADTREEAQAPPRDSAAESKSPGG